MMCDCNERNGCHEGHERQRGCCCEKKSDCACRDDSDCRCDCCEGSDCCSSGKGQSCACSGCDCDSVGFRRRFKNKAEIIAELEDYLAELKAESQGVEERLKELRA